MPSAPALGLAALILAGSAAGATAQDARDPARVEEVASGLFVRPGVHALSSETNAGGIANIGFIIGRDAVAVIDSGGSLADGEALLAAIEHRTELPVRYVINTHAHPDHVLGNAAFVGGSTDFVGHRRLAAAMAARGVYYLEAAERLLGNAFEGSDIIPPTLQVTDRLELDLGDRVLILTAWPTAHTDSDLTVFDQRSGVLWTGDLLFVDHLPVLDGNLKGWFEVMTRLSALPAARVVPGHGPVAMAWPEALAAQRRYLTVLARDLRAMIAAGNTIGQAAGEAAASERGFWQLFDQFNPRNATAGFAELEWE